MADWFIFMVYLGGALTDRDEKRGFWSRVGWPLELGETIYFWVRAWKND